MEKLAKLFGFQMRTIKYLILILFNVITITLSVLSVEYFIEYSSFFIGLSKASIAILFLNLIDDVIFNKIDTIAEIKKENTAYALIYIANALIIAFVIAFS